MLWVGQEGCAWERGKPILLFSSVFLPVHCIPDTLPGPISNLGSQEGELEALVWELTFVQSHEPQVGPDPDPKPLVLN